MSRTLLLFSALLFLMLAGCGSRHPPTVPVSGLVAFADGTPIRGGRVEFESEQGGINARGTLDAEGEFHLSTFRDGDGAVVGRHRVIVQQTVSPYAGTVGKAKHGPHGPPPTKVPTRYGDYRTSPLTVNVTTDPKQRIVLPLESDDGPRKSNADR